MKGVSPVIATVIIVAVAITLSIAVALWITGITGTLTGIERIEVVNARATYSNGTWTVKIDVKNTGTKPATIEHIYANDNEITEYTLGNGDEVLDVGESDVITFTLSGSGYDHGVTVSIIIVTSSGGKYPVTITLP